MGIHISWDDDAQTCFRYHFEEQWTWDEFFAAKDHVKIMMDARL